VERPRPRYLGVNVAGLWLGDRVAKIDGNRTGDCTDVDIVNLRYHPAVVGMRILAITRLSHGIVLLLFRICSFFVLALTREVVSWCFKRAINSIYTTSFIFLTCDRPPSPSSVASLM